MKLKIGIILTVIAVALLFFYSVFGDGGNIDYNTQVKPIINKHCIACHGGVKQSAGFSLLNREWALKSTESGRPAIIPGSPDSSEFIRRLHLEDTDERMPFGAHKLSEKDIEILTRWIKEGAEWGVHWAYRPIKEYNEISTALGSLSNPDDKSGISKLIDEQVKLGLKDIGLDMNKQASKPELLRRVSFDLIGMPAPKALQNRYLRKDNPISYERLVHELLSLPLYGEKWASMWLDVARYADSKGFERDPNRTIWPYRDYVIKSFNEDKPYNDFLVEQLAGDMLDHPSPEQWIATGFHRNTTTNDEGGTNNEEFRVKAVLDRVSTTWGGIMGTTMACVQCHSHPYDPITHEGYYQSVSFFNNTRDADTAKDYPLLKFMDSLSEHKLKDLTTWVSNVEGSQRAKEIENFVRVTQPVYYSIETDNFINADLYDTKYLGLRKNGSARLPQVSLTGKKRLWMVVSNSVAGGKLSIHLDNEAGPLITQMKIGAPNRRFHLVELPLSETQETHDLYFKYSNPSLKNPNTRAVQFDWFYFTEEFPGENTPEIKEHKAIFKNLLEGRHETTMVMFENPEDMHRKTYVFDRGNWQVLLDEVHPDVPSVLPPFKTKSSYNRLDFANWIADEENPLTARTFVNRVWEQLIGRGIVVTVEDLGSQGTYPSHPKILDGLSYHWMHDQKWSLKKLIESIVLTDAYQQSAIASKQKLEKDPNNTYLSRGPRVRLNAEQIRDQALYVSGSLSSKMYGPPVMPYQPDGIWSAPYGSDRWKTSSGEDQFRRSIYTLIKRSAVYPSMETFDMSQRQVCVSRRIRTNTPLQALVTLNDPVFVEASQLMADRMKNEGGEDISDQIEYGYRLAMSRDISLEKNIILTELYKQSLLEFEKNASHADVGSATDKSVHEQELMALANVANAILNLDEMLNK